MRFLGEHRWITPKAKCQKSKIEGLGTIALKSISKGEIVGVLGGIVIPIARIIKYQRKFGHIGIQINEKFFICPSSRKELIKTGVFNHSCEPNIGYLDSNTFIAIRNIKKGEELCLDYAFSETKFRSFKCNCSKSNCRKIIKPDDWKIKEIRSKYKNYFSPYLKYKITKKH